MYVFDDNDDQIPPAYLAKTPIPLRTLATGREIRGEEESHYYIIHQHLLLEEAII